MFEELQNKPVLKRLAFIDPLNVYLTRDEYSDDDLTIQYCLEINHGWKMWCASASREGYKLVPVDEYYELVRSNRYKHEQNIELSKEVKILRDRKKYYKSKYKAMIGASE